MSQGRTWFRRLRTAAWTALTLVTLLAAVMVGIGKLLMPYSARYQPQLEAWISREFNQPVRIDSFRGEWKAFGPRISLEGVNLLGQEDGRVIAIEHAALDIKPLHALLSGRPLYSFRIIGADLSLVRDDEGKFLLSGLGVSGRGDGAGGESGLGGLARLGEVVLEQGRLSFDDLQRDLHLRLANVDGRLQMRGDRLALAVEAGIADDQGRVLGEIGATGVIVLDETQRLAEAEWHVETGEMSLAELASHLPREELRPSSGWLNGQLWGTWKRGEPQRMEGVLDLRGGSLESPEGPLQLERLNTRFRWRFDHRRSWRIDLADARLEEGGRTWSTPRLSVERNIPGGLGVWVSADFLEVEFPLRLTRHLMGLFNARWPNNVPTAGSGQIRDFHILIDADKQFAGAAGRFENLAATQWGKWPRVSGLVGSADMAFGEGDIEFTGSGVVVEWPRNFRAPAVVDIPACGLEILWDRSAWLVDANDCTAQNPAIELRGRTRFTGTRGMQGKPSVDINVLATGMRLADLHDYWPATLVKPKLAGWLERALKGGEVSQGRFILQGDLDDFPFRDGEGTLDAVLQADGLILDYYPGWPVATGVDVTARFQGAGMAIHGSIGDIGGAPVDQAGARIADFRAPLLEVDYATTTSLQSLAGFIDASPLLQDSSLDLDRFRFTSAATTHGVLRVPLGGDGGRFRVAGSLDLPGNGFEVPDAALLLDGIQGQLAYDQDGFTARGLAASWHQRPAVLGLDADWDAPEPFSAQLEGVFPASMIVAQSPLADDPLLARLSGEAPWRARLSVSRSSTDADAETWLQLDSDLHGVHVDLPAPLDKPPDLELPLRLRYPIDAPTPVFSVELGDRMTLLVETSGGLAGPRRATVHLGTGDGQLPAEGAFTVSGHAARFDMDGWLDVVVEHFTQDRVPGDLVLTEAALHAEELRLLDRALDNVSVTMAYRDEVLEAIFDGAGIVGTVRYNRTAGQAHSLGADFDRLYLPAPVDQGMTMDTDPRRLPELHLYARDFRYLGLELGETRIEAFPQGDGLRIDSVEAVNETMNFQARGDWLSAGEGNRSDFDIVLTSESLGALVKALNLSSVLEGGQTVLRYDAWWPGSPAAFALAALNGEMQFNVIDGRILNADPGAGRVLGLISVAALPRRLALDFRDVFETGFSFDTASGTVRLENGMAHTDDFRLQSTAATLSVQGSSDLVAKSFDYEMTVRPGVSQALPVIGALAGGPGGAAAGLALQGLLRDALGDAAEARYRITGPWSGPEVVRVDVASGSETPAEPTATEPTAMEPPAND